MKRFLTAAIVAITAATSAPAETVIVGQKPGRVKVVKNNSGGFVRAFGQRYNEAMSRGERVEIRGEFCTSSCTFWLSYPWVCVEPETQFQFHGPHNGFALVAQLAVIPVPLHHYMDEGKRAALIADILTHYALNGNEALAEWVRASGALQKFGVGYAELSGRQVHEKFGKPFCPSSASNKRTVQGDR